MIFLTFVCGDNRRKRHGRVPSVTAFRLMVPTPTVWTTPSTAQSICGTTTERAFCSSRCGVFNVFNVLNVLNVLFV